MKEKDGKRPFFFFQCNKHGICVTTVNRTENRKNEESLSQWCSRRDFSCVTADCEELTVTVWNFSMCF